MDLFNLYLVTLPYARSLRASANLRFACGRSSLFLSLSLSPSLLFAALAAAARWSSSSCCSCYCCCLLRLRVLTRRQCLLSRRPGGTITWFCLMNLSAHQHLHCALLGSWRVLLLVCMCVCVCVLVGSVGWGES